MLQIGNSLDILLSLLSFDSLGFPNMEDASAFAKPHSGTCTRYCGLLEDVDITYKTYYSSGSSSSV